MESSLPDSGLLITDIIGSLGKKNARVKCRERVSGLLCTPLHKMAAEGSCYGNILLTLSLHPPAIKITSHVTSLHFCLVRQLNECHYSVWVRRRSSIRLFSAHTQTRLGIRCKLEVGKCFYSWCCDQKTHGSLQVTMFWIPDVTKTSMNSVDDANIVQMESRWDTTRLRQ